MPRPAFSEQYARVREADPILGRLEAGSLLSQPIDRLNFQPVEFPRQYAHARARQHQHLVGGGLAVCTAHQVDGPNKQAPAAWEYQGGNECGG